MSISHAATITVTKMMADTGSEHHTYVGSLGSFEAEKANKEWAGWYAETLITKGIGDVIPALKPSGPQDVGRVTTVLAGALTRMADNFGKHPQSKEWPEYYASKLSDQLSHREVGM